MESLIVHELSSGDSSLDSFHNAVDKYWDSFTSNPEYKARFYDDRPLDDHPAFAECDDTLPTPLGSVP